MAYEEKKYISEVNAEFQRGIEDGHLGVKRMPENSLTTSGTTRFAKAYLAGLAVARAEMGDEDALMQELGE